MAILDSQGRLFGKVSILDIGAALVILMVLGGIFVVPGDSGSSIAQIGGTKPIEVDVLAIGFKSSNPAGLNLKAGEKTNFIIRNQRYGQVDIKTVEDIPRLVEVAQPDGSVKGLPDPRPEFKFAKNLLFTLEGKGQITDDGPVLGNSKIKVGTPVELEGPLYNFKASVVDVRITE